MESTQQVLWFFYYHTQILQSDRACLLLNIFRWNKFMAYSQNMHDWGNNHGMDVVTLATLQGDIKKRDTMIRRCGIVELCICLWPSPTNVTMNIKAAASRQVDWLVDKQWMRGGGTPGLWVCQLSTLLHSRSTAKMSSL